MSHSHGMVMRPPRAGQADLARELENPLNYRTLGKTGLRVSELGFGTWGLGGIAYGPVHDQESIAALLEAFARGVNFYDTSDLYGDGHSEALLGEAFAQVRSQVIIASKVGTLPHSGFYMPQDFSAAHILKSIEGSLRRLQTDYIDLYQLHSPTLDTILSADEALEALQKLQQQGKIRHYGISARSPKDARVAIEELGIPVVQLNLSIIDQRAIDGGILDAARAANTGIIGRTPLCFGYLTGKLTGEESLVGQDHRKNWPKDQLKRWAESVSVFDFLTQDCRCTAAQIALRFCLDCPGVSTVIPGMLNVEQVRENLQTSDLPPLSIQEMERARIVYQSHQFYDPAAKKI